MKPLLALALFSLGSIALAVPPTGEKPTIYNPAADAAQDIKSAVEQAKREKKHVLLQIGGNWCGWCVKLHQTVKEDDDLQRLLNDNFVAVHVNYSQENKNEKILADLGYPQRFGFPVLVILDSDGKRLHTQDSAYLEEGAGHSKKKLTSFLRNWGPPALDPQKYVKKS